MMLVPFRVQCGLLLTLSCVLWTAVPVCMSQCCCSG